MKITIKRTNDDYGMLAVNDTGNTVAMDGSESLGGKNFGMRPMQLLLVALGGCSAIDIINILKKQRQDIQSLEIDVDGNSVKHEDHSVYEEILVTFRMTGTIDPEKARKAAILSFTKYCSVSKALEYSSKITYSIRINGEEILT